MNGDGPREVFLGGACGHTTWRRDIAIPLLENAGVTYHNPQMGFGDWQENDQLEEMRRKDECLVQLFVITGHTRGVASVAEVAYLIGAAKPVAIVLTDVETGSVIYDRKIDRVEADDLNRGRIFVRAMAERHAVPIFTDIARGAGHCIELVKSLRGTLTLEKVEEMLSRVSFSDLQFNAEPAPGGFHIWLRGLEVDTYTGEPAPQEGRKWFVSVHCTPSDVVRTAFKAVVTWQEHEVREHFKYSGKRVFSPHLNIDDMASKEDLKVKQDPCRV